MASSHVAVQRGLSSLHGRPLPGTPASHPVQQIGWIPIAVGAAAIAARLAGRKNDAAALALTAAAGVAAVGALRGVHNELQKARSKRYGGAGTADVARSITIGKGADELRRFWRDPRTLPQIAAGFATVRATGDGRMHWKVEGPFGGGHEWDTETVDGPAEGIGWRARADGAVAGEGWLRFHPAPADRGTVVALQVRFDPPGGALGDWILELLGSTPLELVAEGMLRRFKNLVEAGEIPTTARQPAARADTR